VKLRIAVLALALALAGCTGDSEPEPAPTVTAASPPAWTEPASYSFVVDRKCGAAPSQGRYKITVTDGVVASRDRVDGKTATGEEEVEAPTLGELTELAQTAIDDGAEVVRKYDPGDGHLTEVAITRDLQECFLISEYAVG
jgi:hypothetical protein